MTDAVRGFLAEPHEGARVAKRRRSWPMNPTARSSTDYSATVPRDDPVVAPASTGLHDDPAGEGGEDRPSLRTIERSSRTVGSSSSPQAVVANLGDEAPPAHGAVSTDEAPRAHGSPPIPDGASGVPNDGRISPAPEPDTYLPRPVPRIMAIANQKGGVGKTTTAVNLGAGLAELGYRVLVVDLDPQGNATTGLGIDGRSFELSMYDVLLREAALEDCVEPSNVKNLFVAPATIDLAGAEIELVSMFSRELRLRRAIEPVVDDFDYVLIDCPPSLGLITVNGLAAARELLVPIQCEYYALEGLGQLLRNVHLVQSNLNEALEVTTIVLTMYDARTKLAEQVADEVRRHFGARVCKNVIPRTVRISEAPSFGQPITVFDPSSRGAIAYRELAREVSGGPA